MQGAGDEAVVFHRESAATKQMRKDRLARKVKVPIVETIIDFFEYGIGNFHE